MRSLLESLANWGADKVDALEIDRRHDIGVFLLEDLADFGLFGASIPEKYGGSGLSMGEVCEIVAALARVDRSIATTVGLHLGLGTRGLIAFGSEAQKSELLPKLASGEWIAAFAATEAGAGSDLSAIRTRAVMDGDDLVLNGEKVFVTNGGMADIFTLLVSTPGLGGARRGHSLIWVHADDPGLSLGAEEDKLGLRGSSTRSVYLDDVRLPMSRVIGEPGRGKEQAHHVLAWGRTAMAAGCTGAATEALLRTLDHVRGRRQFGRALSELAVVREQLAGMSARLYAMEALVQYTASAAGDHETLARRSTATKVFCSDGDWGICDLAVQLHGGSGFIEETGLPLLLRDARITRIFEGANDVLRTHAGALEAVAAPTRESLGRRFEEDELALGADVFAMAASALRQIHVEAAGIRLLRDKRKLHRIGSAAILREATDAATIRALMDGTPGARAHAEHWQATARQDLAALHHILPAAAPMDALLASRFAGETR
jgi:alkylation response protein AidB-like acyl-CoA dehydrogenase